MCVVIVVDARKSRSSCLGCDAYIHNHCLDILTTMRSSINCLAVICSPTVIHVIMREATSETYGPRVYLHHINLLLLSYFLCFLLCLYFTLHLYHKNIKNIILSYLSDLTLVSGLIGIDNPYLCWLRGFICFVQVRGIRA